MPHSFPIPYLQDEHEARIRLFFNLDMNFTLDLNSSHHDEQVIFLCFTNRSGSNYLSELLGNYSGYKILGEFFNYEEISNFYASNERDIRKYLFGILTHCKEENKTPVFKVSWSQLLFLTKIGYIGKYIKNPTFIHLKRRDVIAQVASLNKASKSNNWSSEMNALSHSENIDESYENLISYSDIDYIFYSNSMIEKYFNYFSITPCIYYYEDILVHNQKDLVEKFVFDLSGVQTRLQSLEIKIKKQSTKHDEHLINMFKKNIKRIFFD